jgi:hypothetical protein
MSARGVQKHHKHIFAKSPCRKLSPKFRQKISMSVFPRLFFCFKSRFRVFLRFSALKNTTKNVLQKKSCRKCFTKNSTKNPKPTFSRFIFYHVFGRFSMRGVQKHDKKYQQQKNLTLVLFRTPTHPPTTGVPGKKKIAGPLLWPCRLQALHSLSRLSRLSPLASRGLALT